jgi:hypothetical protein
MAVQLALNSWGFFEGGTLASLPQQTTHKDALGPAAWDRSEDDANENDNGGSSAALDDDVLRSVLVRASHLLHALFPHGNQWASPGGRQNGFQETALLRSAVCGPPL